MFLSERKEKRTKPKRRQQSHSIFVCRLVDPLGKTMRARCAYQNAPFDIKQNR